MGLAGKLLDDRLTADPEAHYAVYECTIITVDDGLPYRGDGGVDFPHHDLVSEVFHGGGEGDDTAAGERLDE